MKIRQKKIEQEKVKSTIKNWNSWGCEPSTFEWEYDDNETAYVFEGQVIVKTPTQEVEIKGGQLVQFPKGLKCTWKVIQPIKKVYTFQKFNWEKWKEELEK
jgi:uncharacterized cupin superfamily protein